jgi:hypothetical protein
MPAAVAPIPGIHLRNPVQQIHAFGLASDVGVMIAFGEKSARVVFAIFGGNLFQLVEEMIELAPL